MDRTFNMSKYLAALGEELVLAFDQAGLATTPGNVGRAREQAVLRKLGALLPAGVGIGSGFVIDSLGNASRQMDLVLYEKNLCPVFTINEDEETSFYPCEGVIAVGEVKSAVGLKELDDILDKIASVRRLDRWCRTEDDGFGLEPTVPFRSYGSPFAVVGTVEEQYEQNNRSKDQIWGFAVARSMATGTKVLVSRLNEFSQLNGATLCPNRVIAMSGICAAPCLYSDGKNSLVSSTMDANAHVAIRVPQPFAFLIKEIVTAFTTGRTVATDAFLQYISGPQMFDTVEGPLLMQGTLS